jgi:hypothetical protein
LASKVEFYNGHNLLSCEEFIYAFGVLVLLLVQQNIRIESQTAFAWSTQLISAREDYLNGDRPDLLLCLDVDAGRLCKLDQDRVYGLLALVNAGPGSNLSIDYNLSVETIFIRVALSYLEENSLNVLHFLGNKLRKSQPVFFSPAEEDFGKVLAQTLPSWVPDCK